MFYRVKEFRCRLLLVDLQYRLRLRKTESPPHRFQNESRPPKRDRYHPVHLQDFDLRFDVDFGDFANGCEGEPRAANGNNNS